jgi:hypothetical protein
VCVCVCVCVYANLCVCARLPSVGAHGHGRSAMLLAGCLIQSREALSLDHAVSMMTVCVACELMCVRTRVCVCALLCVSCLCFNEYVSVVVFVRVFAKC